MLWIWKEQTGWGKGHVCAASACDFPSYSCLTSHSNLDGHYVGKRVGNVIAGWTGCFTLFQVVDSPDFRKGLLLRWTYFPGTSESTQSPPPPPAKISDDVCLREQRFVTVYSSRPCSLIMAEGAWLQDQRKGRKWSQAIKPQAPPWVTYFLQQGPTS